MAPVVANERLFNAQHIGFVKGSTERVTAGITTTYLGIVDPFLKRPVEAGERFWMFLYPNTITSLRHDWIHPTFEQTGSELWLRQYADRYRADYDDMIAGAVSGEGYCFGDDDGPPQYSGTECEFWGHIEAVTGKSFDENHRERTPFRCAC